MKYMFVRISDFLKNTALEMSHCVSTRIEMVARWLFQHFRPHILFVFSHAKLERSGAKANIFTPRVVRAIVLNTFPVVDYSSHFGTYPENCPITWLVGSMAKGHAGHCRLLPAQLLHPGLATAALVGL